MKKSTKIVIIIIAVILVLGAGVTAFRFIAPESFEKITGAFNDNGKNKNDNNSTSVVENADKDSAGKDNIINPENSSIDEKNTNQSTVQDEKTLANTGDNIGSGDSKTVDGTDTSDKSGEASGDIREGNGKTDATGTDGFSDLLSMYASGMAEMPELDVLSLPQNENEISFELALQAISLCSGGSKSGQASLLKNAGFEIVLQDGYDKSSTDVSHTCAFTVGKKKIDFYGGEKTLFAITIRGTSGSEWFSNFDYADSHTDDSKYAENFLEAAQVIGIKLIPVLSAEPDALIIVCGHSRGAAAANLLGMTLDDMYGQEGIYVYTFATPNTYRGDREEIEGKYGNIFNFINPADVVTEVPLKSMGYSHIGTDIVLPCEPETVSRIAEEMEVLHVVSPTIKDYYTVRHSLTGPGLSDAGYTAHEIMQALASSLTGMKSDINGGINMQDVYDIIDSAPEGKKSDFAPLADLVSKLIGRDGSYGVSIFMQHMPTTYMQLIKVYAQMYRTLQQGNMP